MSFKIKNLLLLPLLILIACSEEEGCTDELACNFDSSAESDDGSCTYAEENYDCSGECLNDDDNDGICNEFEVQGCMDELACNYDSSAEFENDSCEYADQNYDCSGECLNDEDIDGVCDELEIEGCTDELACNFDITATDNFGCEYFDICGICGGDCDAVFYPQSKAELQIALDDWKEQNNIALESYGEINTWDVSLITDMSYLFSGTQISPNLFNDNISNWNVSNVTNMNEMFTWATEFNQDLSNWEVSNVSDMRYMFLGAYEFASDLSSWNVSNVIDMNSLFYFN